MSSYPVVIYSRRSSIDESVTRVSIAQSLIPAQAKYSQVKAREILETYSVLLHSHWLHTHDQLRWIRFQTRKVAASKG